jgi:hypothetical protein
MLANPVAVARQKTDLPHFTPASAPVLALAGNTTFGTNSAGNVVASNPLSVAVGVVMAGLFLIGVL